MGNKPSRPIIINPNKFGYFGLLPRDLSDPSYIRRYLSGSDFKLLLLAFGFENVLKPHDIQYYCKSKYSNIELYKYYNVRSHMEDIALDNNGDLEIFKFLHNNGGVLDENIYCYSVSNVPLLEYLQEQDVFNDIDFMIIRAAEEYDIKSVTHFIKNGFIIKESIYYLIFKSLFEYRRINMNELEEPVNEYKNISLIRILFVNLKNIDYESIFVLALSYCDYYVIKHMIDNDLIKPDTDYYQILINSYNIVGKDHLDWLFHEGITLFNFLKKLHKFGCILNIEIIELLLLTHYNRCYQFLMNLAYDDNVIYLHIFRHISLKEMQIQIEDMGFIVTVKMLSFATNRMEIFEYLIVRYIKNFENVDE